MLDLESAIKHCEEVADGKTEQGKCPECAMEHRQLAEWLTDYKRLKEQQPCEDAVSRQAAIDALEKVAELFPWRVPGKRDTYDSYNGAWNDAIGRAEMEFEGLPPVAPQPKTGHWIIIDDCEQFLAKCSECGRIEDIRMISKYPYCHCGAKMVEPQESEGKDGNI